MARDTSIRPRLLPPDKPVGGRGHARRGFFQPRADEVGGDKGPVRRIPQQDGIGAGQGEQRRRGGRAGRDGVLLPLSVTSMSSKRPSAPSGPAAQLALRTLT